MLSTAVTPAPPLISTTGRSLASSSTKSPTGAWTSTVPPSSTEACRKLETSPGGTPGADGGASSRFTLIR